MMALVKGAGLRGGRGNVGRLADQLTRDYVVVLVAPDGTRRETPAPPAGDMAAYRQIRDELVARYGSGKVRIRMERGRDGRQTTSKPA